MITPLHPCEYLLPSLTSRSHNPLPLPSALSVCPSPSPEMPAAPLSQSQSVICTRDWAWETKGYGNRGITAIAGLQVQPPGHRFTRTFSSGNHLLTFYLFCVLSLPLLEQKFHTGVGVLTSEGLSECLAGGRLNRLKSELKFGAQGLADAKHKKVVAITTISLQC